MVQTRSNKLVYTYTCIYLQKSVGTIDHLNSYI